ncbi:VOC family protein [Amycolatopsis magusensis]|uniref:Catechol 2,3-dioxygenase-like lactoylglutathione lyase family enzyme n=1 Tax=Amycolatopsis magusensis TaxID=882444 RepID=A0ABS4PQK3_9PSEU|nr:VOC family protein [Amycolatopsis magusensis]MBP2181695.1 catechol 2,3-dioxygenase-like lactoylglutathione lyase family enzyme [Amycolatopsis magusensis]
MGAALFAGISVSDFPAALAWYEKLFGVPPTFFPNDIEAVWEIEENRYVYLELRPEHAGHALLTLFVDDLEGVVTGITGRGLEPAGRETYSNGVRKITYRDQDGNELSYGGGPA